MKRNHDKLIRRMRADALRRMDEAEEAVKLAAIHNRRWDIVTEWAGRVWIASLLVLLGAHILAFPGCKSHTQGIDPKLVPESGYLDVEVSEPVSLSGDVHQALKEVETGERFREWRGK